MRPLQSVQIILLLILSSSFVRSQGQIYFVIGSDTGIWDGLDVSHYHCTIGPTLYTDPGQNATQVMDPLFRAAMVDYFGTPMKLTWWMMAGNMFRLSVNTDVPTPSTMPVYLMKRYEGSGVRQWGDELSFHFHDWYWSDENGDGVWYWNQAPSFSVVTQEFDQTLAELLIEEDLFPVSFRSGWHAMDDGWQRRLDEILPFSMHNDYPSVHADPIEPVDNVYDWSRAPSARIPFHPSPTDYQIPGNCKGWNLRSQYMSVADSAFMAGIFAAAQQGTDQVVCLWAHLPEADFLQNLQKVNTSAHAASVHFPNVPYRYCTAVEAMQRWLHTTDTTKPGITLTEIADGDSVGWIIGVNEPIFQAAPVLAVKDRYEDHRLLPLQQRSPFEWQTARSMLRSEVAEVAVAATDTSGNLATKHLLYLTHDIFVDNGDAGYQEVTGTWSTVSLEGWGASYRAALVTPIDSAVIEWAANLPATGLYSIFLRIPATSSPCDGVHIMATNGIPIADTLRTAASIAGNQWLHVATTSLDQGHPVIVRISSRSTGPRTLTADVLRITPLVREKWIIAPERIDAGDFISGKEQTIQLPLQNAGIEPVAILSAGCASGAGTFIGTFPRSIPAMSATTLELSLKWDQAGAMLDTLILTTDDAHHAEIRIVMSARVHEYYVIVDDRDSTGYQETGSWAFSVAQAYGPTSRYAYPTASTTASFLAQIEKAGRYEISEIVPTTVNASDRAKYVLRVFGNAVDSIFIDQNQGSGAWVHLMTDDVPTPGEVRLTVSDAMSPVIAGRVLRADAVRFQWIGEPGSNGIASTQTLPRATRLLGNYPNPFNPATRIDYEVASTCAVRLVVYDMIGREVAVLVDSRQAPGVYEVQFDASGLSSGIYFCKMVAGNLFQAQKMVVIK